jgi:hypothetical protein
VPCLIRHRRRSGRRVDDHSFGRLRFASISSGSAVRRASANCQGRHRTFLPQLPVKKEWGRSRRATGEEEDETSGGLAGQATRDSRSALSTTPILLPHHSEPHKHKCSADRFNTRLRHALVCYPHSVFGSPSFFFPRRCQARRFRPF